MPTKTHTAILVLGVVLAPTAMPQTSPTCPAGQSACVREIGDDPYQQHSPTQDQVYQDQTGVVDEQANYPYAVVRDLPEQISWGWEPVDIQDNSTLPGQQGYPAQIAAIMMCARSPHQALAWISSGGNGDEAMLNRAMTAYDWKGRGEGQVEGVANWLANWPAGYWEQQYQYREYEQGKPVARFRFVDESGQVYSWVSTHRSTGCWFVSVSPPKVHAEDIVQYDQPQQLPEQLEENPHIQQESEGLYILWEAQD